MLEPGPSKRISLRRSLVIAAFTLVFGALLAFISALYALVVLPASDELATSQLRVASEQVEARIGTLVDRVEAIARLNHDWGQRGLIDIEQPERFNTLMQPLLDKVLRRFLDMRVGDVAELRTALAAGDGPAIANLTHGLVTNAGTIGAVALSDAARHLQVAADTDERALWPVLADEFARQHALVMAALAIYFNRKPSTETL